MFSRSMSSVVMTETVAGTSSSGRRVRVAAVVTASSCVGTGWPGVTMGVVVLPGHCAAGGGGVVLPVASGAAGATGVAGVCAKVGRAIVPPIAVLASNRQKNRL